MDTNDRLLTCYAAFLGKAIGVRLGAPVENWTAEHIAARYPDLEAYPVDYGVFAADDDTNGPLFFVRSVWDGSDSRPLAQRVADAFLNYIPDHAGFFWWGGSGVATEQTAYENLQRGVRPPMSGSMATNGKTLAEQIGGQIFSDCWGYVNPRDPKRAADMAEQAASVTHDGEALQGARFVAAAIAAAPGAPSVRAILEAALQQLRADSAYATMARAVIACFERHKNDWRACLSYIRETYCTAEYGGVCHILPNAAVMILSLCYGGGDFSKTLCICCRCGMDTDCNCGNAGSILGAHRGLAGIPEQWILPINDVMLCSSGVGYYNMGSVSGGARMFAAIAGHKKKPGQPPDWRFTLPYETKGAVAAGGTIRQSEGALCLCPARDGALFYWHSYYLPGEIYDARYEPTFAPLVYPGGTVRFVLSGGKSARISAYVETDRAGMIFSGFQPAERETELSVTVPPGCGTVLKFGVCVRGAQESASIRLHAIAFDHRADFEIRFPSLETDDYGERFAGGRHRVPRGFTAYGGDWALCQNGLAGRIVSGDSALITTGDPAFSMRKIAIRFSARDDCGCYAAFAVRGGRRYYACGLFRHAVELRVREDERERVLLCQPLSCAPEAEVTLTCLRIGNELCITVGGETLRYCLPDAEKLPRGAVGILLCGAGEGVIHALSVQA